MIPENLIEFFKKNNKVALGFSGGVDSSYLLYAAKVCGADVQPYFIKTEFQPKFELDDAKKMTKQLGLNLKIIELDILSDSMISNNCQERCYYCKRKIFSTLIGAAKSDGYNIIIDGTNASDDAKDRPGMKAIRELGVRSPLRESNITKDELRYYSKKANLFTWDKPAYACLATRIPTNEIITSNILENIENAEKELFKLGFNDFRIRLFNGAAKLQIKDEQFEMLLKNRILINKKLKTYFNTILLDLESR